MTGWYHQLNGREFEQAPGHDEGQEVWCAAVHQVARSQTQQMDKTTATHQTSRGGQRSHTIILRKQKKSTHVKKLLAN